MSDFKPEVVSQLDDLIKRKGKPNQDPSADKDKAASVTQTSKEGVNIHAQGDVHYHAAPSPILPTINEMSKKEREAFDSGQWDGIEKRNKNPRKEELAAARKHKRRQQDIQNNVLHYTLIGLLFLFLFGSLAIGILLDPQI